MWFLLFSAILPLLVINGQRLSPKEDQEARKRCGKIQNTQNLFKIINGEPASWEEAPWIVQIGGGTGAWISDRHILTASHVVGVYLVYANTCRYAKHSSVAYDYPKGATTRSVRFTPKRRFVPLEFTQVGCEPESEQLKRGTFNDLAIIEVEVPENRTFPHAWACLPEKLLKNLTTVHVYGYGVTETGNNPRDYSLRTFNSTAYIVENSFDLMRFYDSERTACNGDSGGPVIEFGSEGTPTIQATVSSGDFYCNLTKLDQVYTLVHPYTDQICAITGRCKSDQHRAYVDSNLDAILSKYVEIFPRPDTK